jgi:cysteine desulfurase
MYQLNENIYGNPSSLHKEGQKARKYIEEAREKISMYLGIKANEIIFTSSGSESNNMAIKGIAESSKYTGNEIISSPIEHSSVKNTLEELSKKGFIIKYVKVNEKGLIDIEHLKNLINANTRLISIIHGNNEIGTLQDIKEIGRLARSKNILFHIDAVQSFGKMLIYPKDLGINLMTFSSHKIYGPKGIGGLYLQEGCKIQKLLDGGYQERNRRAGTENTVGICAFAKATEIIYSKIHEENKQIEELRNYMEKQILKKISDVEINGSIEKRLPNLSSISIKNTSAESILYALDIKGVCISSGSACSSGALKSSHVLNNIGFDKKKSLETLRISLGRYNTKEEIDSFVNILSEAVSHERNFNDLY